MTSLPKLELDSIWSDDILRYYNYPKDPISSLPNQNGERLFISINLKSLEPITPLNKDDVVLSIKLPYVLYDNDNDTIVGSDFVKFSNLPKVSGFIENDTMQIYDSRGDFRGIRRDIGSELIPIPGIKTFDITAGMLDSDGNGTPDSNITLSAFTHFNNNDTLINGDFKWNPFLEPDYYQDDDIHFYIDKLNMEVKYHGNLDLAIDWIRLETPRAREIYDGKFDTEVYIYAKQIMDELADEILRNPKLFRFYGADELLQLQWGLNRYFNLLLDTLGSTETLMAKNPTRHFSHCLGFKDLWTGDNVQLYTQQGVPYIQNAFTRDSMWIDSTGNKKRDTDSPEGFNILYGYKGRYHRDVDTNGLVNEYQKHHILDTLDSGYEILLSSNGNEEDLPISETNMIFDSLSGSEAQHIYYSHSPLFNVEYKLYQNYKKNPYMLFGEKFWWANPWILTSGWDNKNYLGSYSINSFAKRPKTGEEVNLITSSALILGAKGFVYWKKSTNGSSSSLGLAPYNNNLAYLDSLPEGEELIYTDSIGGDFKQYPDPNLSFDGIDTNNLRLDLFNVNSKRIYVGIKSTRAQIYKMHKWIDHVSEELMDLRLQAWHGKGYKKWDEWNQYNSFKQWSHTPLERVVYLDSIRTRKLFQPDYDSRHNYNPDYEHQDSSFFDLTLLQNKNDLPKDLYNRKKSFYLGFQNRRTDPLIYRDSNFYQPGGYPPPPIARDFRGEIMFFSTAEMDSNVRFGGKDLWDVQKSADWWQDQWWQRFGVRELSIPINVPVYGNGTYLIAEELGVESMDTLGWWFADSLYHRIDTSLMNGDRLIAKLQPGQGKIVKLTYIPYFFNDPTKDSIPDNDSCYFCDIYNDFDLFDFEVEKIGGEFEECCYDISITYNGNCEFEDIPFRLLFEGESGNTFLQNMPPGVLLDSSGTNIKFKNFEFNLDSTTGTINLGTYCISDSSNNYSISLLAGKDKGDRFIGCDREMQFKVECGGTEEVKDCCEGLTVTDSMYTNGGMLNGQYTVYEYCTIWKIDNAFDSDCIYGVTLGDGDVVRDLITSNGYPIDFTQPALPILGFCTTMAICPGDTNSGDIKMTKLRFLGKDGTTVCEVDVPIWVPCSSMDVDDVLAGGPTPKSIIKKDKNVKSFSFDNLTLNLWPNPAQNELNLEINSKLSGSANISLINNLGQSVNLYQNYSLSRGLNNLNINLTDVRQGMYYIQILKDGSKVTVPFVITK